MCSELSAAHRAIVRRVAEERWQSRRGLDGYTVIYTDGPLKGLPERLDRRRWPLGTIYGWVYELPGRGFVQVLYERREDGWLFSGVADQADRVAGCSHGSGADAPRGP